LNWKASEAHPHWRTKRETKPTGSLLSVVTRYSIISHLAKKGKEIFEGKGGNI